MELFFDLLFTSVCVFIPKCGLFAGLNFEAIRVVLIDVLLLVYLIYVRPYRMDHYKSTVIILNAQLRSKPASFTWKLTRTAFFCLPLWESNCKWMFESLSPHFKKLFKKMLLTALGSSPVWAWRALKTGKRAEFCASDASYIQELPYRWFCSLCTSLPKNIEMFTEMPWQHYFRSRKFLTKIQALSLHVLDVVISKL